MFKILCSTGALLGKSNNRDYKLLKELSTKLTCDGFEFMKTMLQSIAATIPIVTPIIIFLLFISFVL